MSDLHITKFRPHYHLRDQDDWRKRVQSIQQSLLDYHLEAATATLAIQDDEIVCIRRVFVPIQINSDQTDYDVAWQWSEQIARELQRALLGDSSFEVLRFRNRLDGIFRFSTTIKEGQTTYDWAWRQIEFLKPTGQEASKAERIEALLTLLIRETNLIIPLLRRFEQSSMLRWFAQQLHGESVQVLVHAAISSAASPVNISQLLSEVSLQTRNFQELKNPDGYLNSKSIQAFFAIIQQAGVESVQKLWATIATLVCFPHVFRHEITSLPALISRIWQAAIGQDHMASPNSTSEKFQTATSDQLPRSLPSSAKDLAQADAANLLQPVVRPEQPSIPEQGLENDPTDSQLSNLTEPISSDQSWQVKTSLLKAQGTTHFGGLLFLLPLVESSGALDLFLGEALLADMTLTEVLHRLALHLYPLSAQDPAALAFAGLMPDKAIPYTLDNELREPQQAIFSAAVTLITDALAARLTEWHRLSLLQRVVERYALIVADPGWFEIRFRLTDVSVPIRRAALDLDPGFIPWLGVVMKYVYE